MTYSVYLEDEVQEEVPTTCIPCLELSQHADDQLSSIWAISLNHPVPTDLSESVLHGLIHYASKFFLVDGKLMCQDLQGHHLVVILKEKQFSLISQVHEVIGHRVIFSTLSNLQERFWWPMLDEDVKWFNSTCHPCQTQQMHHLHLPLTITDIPTLFHKVHIDTMLTVNRFCYLIQAHYALFSWPEWSYLQKENEKTLRDFIFEDILCQWGGVAEIVTDNGPTFVAAVGYLSSIDHIKSSPYNSQANGIIECKNFNICKSFMKMCNNKHLKWINMAPLIFWAGQVTVCLLIGYSPYFMAHGVEAVLPLDISEATYHLPPLDVPSSTE